MIITKQERAAFWRFVRQVAREVKAWPAWKKGAVDRPPSPGRKSLEGRNG